MKAGLHVPTIPFGEVVASVGTVLPEQMVRGVMLKSGTVPLLTVTFTTSEMVAPQEFVAVSVTGTTVPALAAAGVNVVVNEFGFENVPLGADHMTD